MSSCLEVMINKWIHLLPFFLWKVDVQPPIVLQYQRGRGLESTAHSLHTFFSSELMHPVYGKDV